MTRICQQAFSEIGDLTETEIAFFGGSFTALPRDYMLELLAAAKPFAAQCRGIRISTRPDCINDEILDILSMYQVTAVELGAQSMDDAVLYRNERGHTAQDVRNASRRIQTNGFELGLQVMPGLYGADVDSDQRTAEAVCEIHPDTVRIYPVVILKGTKLGDLLTSGAYCPMPFAEMVKNVSGWCGLYRAHGIRVIKVGLHASEFVAEKAIGGYYHPAFRELCESVIYRNRMESALTGLPPELNRTFLVHPSCISKAVGQNRSNIRYFQDTYGACIKVLGDEDVLPFEVRMQGENHD